MTVVEYVEGRLGAPETEEIESADWGWVDRTWRRGEVKLAVRSLTMAPNTEYFACVEGPSTLVRVSLDDLTTIDKRHAIIDLVAEFLSYPEES